jgi:hypothetical protein
MREVETQDKFKVAARGPTWPRATKPLGSDEEGATAACARASLPSDTARAAA